MSSQPGNAPQRLPDRRRRRYPRYRSEFAVSVGFFSGSQHQQLDAHCKDLSEAGMGTLIAAELNLGEVVTLTFSIPGMSQPLEVRAVLRHRWGYHYGFEFLSLSASQKTALTDYLNGLERADSD